LNIAFWLFKANKKNKKEKERRDGVLGTYYEARQGKARKIHYRV
jgi:hypothetical protein